MHNKIAFSFLLVFLSAVPVQADLPEESAFRFCFHRAGVMYHVSPDLLKAIARVESGLNPSALNRNRNGSYDYGLMQINSRWYETLGDDWRHLSDPCYNVLVGAWILRQCIDRYGYTWDAVACYHTGKGIPDLHGAKQKRALAYVRKVQDATWKGRK
jgi:soluble lytic murein transglycosylase-like protein